MDNRTYTYRLPVLPRVDLPGQRERRELEVRIGDAQRAIDALYPNGGLIRLKMNWGGTINTSYQLALAALLRGDAVLLDPNV